MNIRRCLTALVSISTLALSSGCTLITAEIEHTSHPLAGYPFGPADEEAALNTLNIVFRQDYSNGVYVEQGLGYKICTHEYDFVGPKVTYTGRIGITLWRK